MKKMKPEVKVVSCQQYSLCKVEASIDGIIKDLFKKAKFSRGERVLIKPNILRKASPELGITTHPLILECIVRSLLAEGLELTIADSPGSIKSDNFNEFLDICEETGVMDIIRRYPSVQLVFVNEGIRKGRFVLYKDLREYDKIVNVAKLKTHILTYFSGAVKNIFGLVPGRHKLDYHARYPNRIDFSKFIADLYNYVNPSYNIIDGIIGMEGNGPSRGNPKYAGLLLGSTNGFAIDAVAMRLVGLDTSKCLYLKGKREADIELKEPYIVRFKEPDTVAEGMNLQYYLENIERFNNMPRPEIIEQHCIGCADCIEVCPESAIDVVGNKAKIDYLKCVKCYCCHELTGCEAIGLQEIKTGTK